MNEGNIKQYGCQAGWVGHLLSQGERCVVLPQGLVGLTEQPQGMRRVGQAPRRKVDARSKGQGAVYQGVVEGDTLV